MDFETIAAILGALGIGSSVGQYLATSGQRRETRSKVLDALSRTESARWVGPSTDKPDFAESIRNLETAALIARLPRSAVDHYKFLAHVGFWLSTEAYERDPDSELGGGGIPSEISDLIRGAANEATQLAWMPWRARIGLKKRLQTRATEVLRVDDDEVQRTLRRAERVVGLLASTPVT